MNFFKKLFSKKNQRDDLEQTIENLFGKNDENINLLVVFINDKILPDSREDVYEKPLDEFLKQNNIGEVLGAGTTMKASGEIDWCNIDIELYSEEIDENTVNSIIAKLTELGAPKGSRIVIDKTEERFYFGKKEGLGIYLDAVNLDKEVYENTYSNFVVSEVKKITEDKSEIIRSWQGKTELGLYFYSDSYAKMNESIKGFVNEYPLCKNARIEQIA